ncbi:MAG: hypothetical protein QW190_00925 [Thermoproteota archaeon]
MVDTGETLCEKIREEEEARVGEKVKKIEGCNDFRFSFSNLIPSG